MISSGCDGLTVLASVYDDGDDSEAKPWQENGWQVFVFTNIEESKWQFWEELMTWGKYRWELFRTNSRRSQSSANGVTDRGQHLWRHRQAPEIDPTNGRVKN